MASTQRKSKAEKLKERAEEEEKAARSFKAEAGVKPERLSVETSRNRSDIIEGIRERMGDVVLLRSAEEIRERFSRDGVTAVEQRELNTELLLDIRALLVWALTGGIE